MGGGHIFGGWAYFQEATVFMQISTNVSLTMAVGVGVAVGVVGPLSSRSDLCEHFREFFSACAQQDLLMWLKGVLVGSDAPISLLETDTTDTLE